MISYPFTAKPILDEGGQPVLDVNGFPTYDRTIDSAMERAFNKQKWTNGVYSYPADGLQLVANNGMKVTLKRGGCQIEGAQGYNQTDLDVTFSSSHSSLERIDRVVVRFDLNDSIRGIEVYKKEGTFSSVPVAPEITQEANYYELVVADVKIRKGATEITQADITDQRLNSELCGVVIPAIPTPLDTSTLYNQYQDSLDQYLAFVASAVNETLAGELQTNIDAVQDNVDDSNGKIQLVQKYNVVTAVTNGDFKCTLAGLSTLTSGDVVKVSFPSATDNTADARLSVDGGTNYKNIYDSANMTANEIENRALALCYNGTQFEVCNSKSVMSSYLLSNYTMTSDSAYESITLTIANMAGNKLSSASGNIKIGSGVSNVLVSANIIITPTGDDGARYLRVLKNDALVALISQTLTGSARTQLTLPPYLLQVAKDDVISLVVNGKAGDVIRGGGTNETTLTVQVIE